MKKARTLKALLPAVYCVPFAFLAAWADATHGTMLFYGIMAAGLALLCWCALRTGDIPIIFIGNTLSFISSCAAAKLSGVGPMGDYFKPFTLYSLIAVASAVSIAIHIIVVLICKAIKKSRKR